MTPDHMPPADFMPWSPALAIYHIHHVPLPKDGFYPYLRCQVFRGGRLLAREWLKALPPRKDGEVVVSFQ